MLWILVQGLSESRLSLPSQLYFPLLLPQPLKSGYLGPPTSVLQLCLGPQRPLPAQNLACLHLLTLLGLAPVDFFREAFFDSLTLPDSSRATNDCLSCASLLLAGPL